MGRSPARASRVARPFHSIAPSAGSRACVASATSTILRCSATEARRSTPVRGMCSCIATRAGRRGSTAGPSASRHASLSFRRASARRAARPPVVAGPARRVLERWPSARTLRGAHDRRCPRRGDRRRRGTEVILRRRPGAEHGGRRRHAEPLGVGCREQLDRGDRAVGGRQVDGRGVPGGADAAVGVLAPVAAARLAGRGASGA